MYSGFHSSIALDDENQNSRDNFDNQNQQQMTWRKKTGDTKAETIGVFQQ